MNSIRKIAFCVAMAASMVLTGGCKTQMPKPSGFLSDYGHLKEANDSTWQYVDTSGLASCDKFMIDPVKVMVTDYLGTTFTTEQQQKLADTFRDSITKALGGRYPVVTSPSPTTGEIRVALTRAYRVGNALAIGAEAEIVNSQTHQQLAAVTGAKIGAPEVGINTNARNVNNPSDPAAPVAGWWNRPAATELMDRWADQVLRLIDSAHNK
jgi:hypothetical protein